MQDGRAPQSAVPQPSTHLVNEGAQRGEDLLERRLRLVDPQEAQVDFKHLLHQWTVAVIRAQLGLQTGRASLQTDQTAPR